MIGFELPFCRTYRPSPFAAPPAESEAEKAAAAARERGQSALSHDRLRWALSIARIHDDPAAHSRADAHDAEGVTVGRDVYFGQPASSAGSSESRALLAHELTHVAQQRRGLYNKDFDPTHAQEHEQEAEEVEAEIEAGGDGSGTSAISAAASKAQADSDKKEKNEKIIERVMDMVAEAHRSNWMRNSIQRRP